MNKKYDKLADALYIKIKNGKVSKTEMRGSDLIDYDKRGNVLGIEILNYSKQISRAAQNKVLLPK